MTSFVRRHVHPRGRTGAAAVVAKRITGDRATSSYGARPYWSKKPHELVVACLRAFRGPGDLVLDPFAGSGGVPLIAARMGRLAETQFAVWRDVTRCGACGSVARRPSG